MPEQDIYNQREEVSLSNIRSNEEKQRSILWNARLVLDRSTLDQQELEEDVKDSPFYDQRKEWWDMVRDFNGVTVEDLHLMVGNGGETSTIHVGGRFVAADIDYENIEQIALRRFSESTNPQERDSLYDLLAKVNHKRGLIYQEKPLRNYDTSIMYLQKASTMYQQEKQFLAQRHVLTDLLNTYTKAEKYDEAQRIRDEIERISITDEDRENYQYKTENPGFSLDGIEKVKASKMLWAQGQREEARAEVRRGLRDIFQTFQERTGIDVVDNPNAWEILKEYAESPDPIKQEIFLTFQPYFAANGFANLIQFEIIEALEIVKKNKDAAKEHIAPHLQEAHIPKWLLEDLASREAEQMREIHGVALESKYRYIYEIGRYTEGLETAESI